MARIDSSREKSMESISPKAKSIIGTEDLKRLAVVPMTLPSHFINLHKMNADDLISHVQYWQSVEQGSGKVTDNNQKDNDDNNESSILAHLAQSKVFPPGDIQHILSDTTSCSSGNKTSCTKQTPLHHQRST